MAVNKSPWSRQRNADKPFLFPGKVQAGSDQAIKAGEICIYNETSGYWVPVNAAADYVGPLAIAHEEQKADGLVRYMEFIAPRETDVFEFALSAAAAVALGDGLIISNSQTLTRDVDGLAIGVSVSQDNYPEVGTSLTNKSYVEMTFNPAVSYYYTNILQSKLLRVMAKTADYTLKLEDNGAIISNKGADGAVVLTAPTSIVPVGFHFYMSVMADQNFDFDPKPDGAKVYIKGAAQAAGKYIRMSDIGDYALLTWDGTDWLAVNSISGADGDITVQG